MPPPGSFDRKTKIQIWKRWKKFGQFDTVEQGLFLLKLNKQRRLTFKLAHAELKLLVKNVLMSPNSS